MIEFKVVIALVWIHFFSDFILQSDWMAVNKSKNNWVLLLHATIYSLSFLLFGWVFALVNGAAHLVTDYYSSRLASKMWREEKTHWFLL